MNYNNNHPTRDASSSSDGSAAQPQPSAPIFHSAIAIRQQPHAIDFRAPDRQQQLQQNDIAALKLAGTQQQTSDKDEKAVIVSMEKISIMEDHYETPGWKISCLQVLPMPSYHRLEKHAFYFPAGKLIAVLQGLENLFRADSLVVEYQDGESNSYATVSARCESLDGVKFVVQIWKDRNSNSSTCSSTTTNVIEIQRTGGDAVLFSQHRYAKRILKVAEQASMDSPTTDVPMIEKDETRAATTTEDPLHYSLSNLQEEQRAVDSLMKRCKVPPAAENNLPSAITIAAELLSSRRFDQVALGLESLQTMTDPYLSGFTMAQKTATTILVGSDATNANGAVAALPDTLAFLAFSGRPLSTMPAADSHLAYYHAGAALRIVAQAVNVVSPSTIRVFANRVQHQYNAVETLLTNVQNAGRSTHTAYVSTQILVALCRAGVPIGGAAADSNRNGCLPVVQHANLVGSHCHAALFQASSRLLEELAVRG